MDLGWATIKYDINGNQKWVAGFSALRPNDITVDQAGNVYVTGTGNGTGDMKTVKYNSNGVQQWASTFNGTANLGDEASAVVVDGSGNVYITGGATFTGTGIDITTIKYNSNGIQQWVQNFVAAPTNLFEAAFDIALDSQGDIYVTGRSVASGNDFDFTTIKYNPAGVQQWVQHFDGPAGSNDQASALVIDGNDNIYVTGGSFGIGTGSDYTTIKYTSSGNIVWIQRFNGPGNGNDRANALVLDADNNVYVTGGSEGSGTNLDYATIGYNSSGDFLFVRRFNGPANGPDQANAIAIDAESNIYVTGRSLGIGTNFDFVTIKYSPCIFTPPSTDSVFVNNGILCFASLDVFENTMKSLIDADTSLALDNGDTEGLLAMVNSDIPPGELKNELLAVSAVSTLSDTVLIAILHKNNPVPPGHVQQIFLANVPFTDRVIDEVNNSSLPPGIKKIILDADDAINVVPNPVLDAFEESLGFTSLRSALEEKQDSLLGAGVDPEVRDIDDFFITDEIIRTVVNPELEIQIGNSIFKYADENTVLKIINDPCFNSLDSLRDRINIPIDGAGDPIAEFDPTNIGDLPNVVFNKTAGKCKADFQHTQSATSLQVLFQDRSKCSHPILKLEWDFGDPTSLSNTSTLENPTHNFTGEGQYIITLTVTDQDGNTDEFMKRITVNEIDPDCCDANDRDKSKWNFYAGTSRKIKRKIYQSNLLLVVHYIGVKTVNYKEKRRGGWKQKKVDKIHASLAGKISIKTTTNIFGDCSGSIDRTINISKTKTNKKKAKTTRTIWGAAAERFIFTKQNAVVSVHFVVHKGTRYNFPPLFLTTDCD